MEFASGDKHDDDSHKKAPPENSSSNRVSVINTTANQPSTISNVTQTPTQSGPSSSSLLTTPILNSQNRIPGEVALTPTHSAFTPQSVNPHSSMTALTPMASGSNQAKNSVRVQ